MKILSHGNNITMFVNLDGQHAIDQGGEKPYHEYFFTPYAAFDPTDTNENSIKTDEDEATLFKRTEQRVKLLQKIASGHEISETEYLAFQVGARAGGAATTIHKDTLGWYAPYKSEATKDFASLLEKIYRLDRKTAWRLAWAFVRAAYLDKWAYIDHLTYTLDTQKSEINGLLESYITALKTEVLR